jgi:hypothetical protein
MIRNILIAVLAILVAVFLIKIVGIVLAWMFKVMIIAAIAAGIYFTAKYLLKNKE